ncbi:MAG TPA: condensation domain-containing protein [Thermoanaerobaculia bacterium]|nr:condensation domain-containing protein [Thermoanaerobaculia bacterium]
MAEPPSLPEPPELKAIPRQRRAIPRPSPQAPPLAPAPAAPVSWKAPAPLPPLPPITRVPRGGPLPAGTYQQWGWESLRGRTTGDFNLVFAVRFSTPLVLTALLASLRELERRQEALRTGLVPSADEPWTICQVIHPPGQLAVPLIDLTLLRGEVQEAELGRLSVEESLRAFDIARPMVRVHLVRLAETEHVLLFIFNHMVCDGWSIEVLRGELATLYEAFAAGRPALLPELPVQFVDFAAWQQQIATSEAIAGQLAYWRRRLTGLPAPLVLDGDWQTAPGRGTAQAACWFSPQETARIRAFARSRASTTPLVILTALGMLLAVYTGETDFVIESKVLGRTRPEVASIIGMFMNTLAHRLDFSGQPGFAEALRRTRDGVLEDYANQDVTYPDVLREVLPGHRQLSRVGFNMVIAHDSASFESRDREEGVFSHEGRRPDVEKAKYDLLLFVREDREELRLMILASADRFLPETATAIAADLEELIGRAVEDPAAPAGRLLPRPRYRQRFI